MLPCWNYSITNFIWGPIARECWACKQPTHYIEVNFESHMHPGLCEDAIWAMYIEDSNNV